MHDLLAPLQETAITVGGYHLSWAEVLGFVTGAWCVWLTVRIRVGNFPVGILNSTFFLVLFLDARLWADASLQVLFIALGAHGWVLWVRRGPDASVMGRAGARELQWVLAGVAASALVLVPVLRAADDSSAFWDAVTTAISLGAQWLLNRKKAQTWLFWITADLIYIPLYASKDLLLTAGVYVLFLGMCFAGRRTWVAEPLVAA